MTSRATLMDRSVRRVPRHVLLTLGVCAAAMILTGCVGPQIEKPIRAIWVTRGDYRTPTDVSRIVDNCADAGFNVILFQVRGNGTVFYRSRIEPWAEQFDYQDPGFDPLELAINKAHARDVQLHAWVNVMPAWRGPNEPEVPNQLYHSRPEWFWYDKDGNRQPLLHKVGDRERGWYVSLNPCLPEVREYLVSVFEEIVANYEVDGLHMDYIRFPREPVVRGETIPDYPRDERTLALYRAATGKAPDDDEDAWTQWRIEQISQLVADVHAMVRRTRPTAALSAACAAAADRATQKYYQDARSWIAAGDLDIAFLMNYTGDSVEFSDRIEPWLECGMGVPIVPGLSFGRQRGSTDRESALTVKEQIEIALDKTGDFCVFSYQGLFDPGSAELARRSENERATRKVRLEVLLPVIRELAEED